MRRHVKRSVERILCRAGITRAARMYHRSGTVVLAYHNIVPDGEPAGGDRSLHLPQREFGRQLDLLRRTHDVVPLAALLEGGKAAARPRAVITFDDAYRGAVTAGVVELAGRGLPATIFVAPAFLGGASFWWDALARPDAAGLPAGIRRHGLGVLQGKDAAIRRWAARRGMPAGVVWSHQTAATEAELARAIESAGMTLASHTWSHSNLRSLDAAELEDELSRPLEWLRSRFDRVIPWLSYPYGLSSAAVERVAERCGYAGAFRIDGGWLPRRPDALHRFALPRINVPAGLSLDGFEIRVSGVVSR